MAKGKFEYWLTPEGLLKLEAWARDGLIDEQIAENAGITTSTLYEWKKKYPDISEALKKGKEIGKTVLCLYLVTVMAVGIMEALYQHTRAGYYIEQMLRGDSRGTMSLCRLLLLAGGAWFGLRYALQAFSEIRNQTKYYYEVTIHYRGKVKTITALLDTGNRLYEPVTRRPVHVVTYEAVRDICESVSSVIYIPFGSVGKKNGVLPGIFLDEMEVRQGDEVKIIKKPLVAVCREPLSADGQYQMLLHED